MNGRTRRHTRQNRSGEWSVPSEFMNALLKVLWLK